MQAETLYYAVATMIAWGTGSFFAKLATNPIGNNAAFWDVIAYAPVTILYCLLAFRGKELLHGDPWGIFWGALAGLTGSVGIILFYQTMTKHDASVAVPLTALYPALTAIMAFIFLKEPLTFVRSVGIFLAVVSVFLLSF